MIGGAGAVGRHVVESLERAGHESVVVVRSRGVDVATWKGLDEALRGAQAVIDVTNIVAPDPETMRTLFGAAMQNMPVRTRGSQRRRSTHG